MPEGAGNDEFVERVNELFPESPIVRALRPSETSGPGIVGVLAYLRPWEVRSFQDQGVAVREVPGSLDARPPRVYENTEGESTDGESTEGEAAGLAIESLRDAMPYPALTFMSGICGAPAPASDAFCPYVSGRSVTRLPSGSSCNAGIAQQLTAGNDTFFPIGSNDYYRVVTVGTSFEGRDILGVRIGAAPSATVPNVPQLVVVAGQHSNEWGPIEMARRLVFRLARDYRDGDATVRAALDAQAILIIPVMNPDGYQYSHSTNRDWRRNRQLCMGTISTDINRNHTFAWGINNTGAYGPPCLPSMGAAYRGDSAASAPETQALRNTLATVGYRSAALINMHSNAGLVGFTEGYSPGVVTNSSVCSDDDNCTAPDLGLFFRLGGTERQSLLRYPTVPVIGYRTGQMTRELYAHNGELVADMVYGTLPPTGGAATPRMMAMLAELDTVCDEGLTASGLTFYENQYRNLALNHLNQLGTLISNNVRAFDLPLVQRRNVPSSSGVVGAAEPMTMRIATRNNLSGVTITNGVAVPGAVSADDVRTGVHYNLTRWRPTGSPYVFPTLSTVCATNQPCRTAMMEGGAGTTVNFCDPARYVAGSAWAWTGDQPGLADECYFNLVTPGVTGAAAQLTTTPRDLTLMRESRLVVDVRATQYSPDVDIDVAYDIEVSSNGFVGCSPTNYGNCRVVRREDQVPGLGIRFRSAFYRTLVLDVADFDGKSQVQVRFRVYDNGDVPTPTTPPGQVRMRVYDTTFVGWRAP
jgi:hypothetical protein